MGLGMAGKHDSFRALGAAGTEFPLCSAEGCVCNVEVGSLYSLVFKGVTLRGQSFQGLMSLSR